MNIKKITLLYKMTLSFLLLQSNYSMQNFEMKMGDVFESMDKEEKPIDFFNKNVQENLETQEIKKINNIFEQAQLKLDEHHKNLQANAVDLWNTIPQYNSMSKEEFEKIIKDKDSCLIDAYIGLSNDNALPKDYIENLEEYMPVFFNFYPLQHGSVLSKQEIFFTRYYFYDQLLNNNNNNNTSMKDFKLIQSKFLKYVKKSEMSTIANDYPRKYKALHKLFTRNSFFTAIKKKIEINQRRKNNLQVFKAKNTLFKKLLQKRALLLLKEEAANKQCAIRLKIKKNKKKLNSKDLTPVKPRKAKPLPVKSDRKTREKKPVNYKVVNKK